MKRKSFLQSFVFMIFTILAFSLVSNQQIFSQEIITKWDFDNETLIPSIGEGVADNVGGTSTAFASGLGGGRAWNTAAYPAQGTNEATAGVQLDVSTDGYQNISVYWDMRHSNTAANRLRLQYTLDGNDWINFEADNSNAVNTQGGNDVGFDNGRYIAESGELWYVRSADLSSISGATGNALFAIRLVSEFVDGSNYGAANPTNNYSPNGTWRFDNITFSGIPITGGNAVKLVISSVNNGASPTVNIPFEVVVQAQDDDGLPANLNTDTQITLTKETGTGSLGGDLVLTMSAGTYLLTFNNVTYNVVETGVSIKASATSGMTLTSGISAQFSVLEAATQLKFVNVPPNGMINQPIAAFMVEARRPDNSIDPTYNGEITVTKQSGPGNISGTTTKAADAGIATFDDIAFSATGNYTLSANATGLTSDISPEIVIIDAPEIISIIIPQFVSGADPVDNRLPFAYRVTLKNLFPNSTYRFINQAVITGDSPTTNGAGNVIFVSPDGTFTRTSSPSFTTPNAYGEFTTNQNGSYTGWFMLETTNNARFTPGNHIFMRIRINDGAGGTNVANYLTVTDSIKVIGFSADTDPNYGTGIRAESMAASKNFAFLYDNATGTGRPLYGTSIETTGIDYNSIPQYTEFYKENVSGVDGAWGGIIPNVNANGVQLIEERNLADGEIAASHVSNNGIWGDANTINPTGGLENILVINLIEDPVVIVNPSSLSGFTYEFGEGPSESQTYKVSGQNLIGQGFITVTAPANYEVSLDGNNFTNTFQLEYLNGQILNQPVTVEVRLKAGLSVGEYNQEQITHTSTITNPVVVTCSGSVTEPIVIPNIATVLLPKYIQGMNGTNVTRLPYAYRVTISNLQPNKTYRYINQVVNYADSPTTNGAGNVIFVKQSESFVRTNNPSMENAGHYGEFTANSSGTYTGWFMTEPTANARFTPGNYLKMRIRINDGMNGTIPIHYLTTADSVQVINFGTTASAEMGTGIRALTNFQPKNFAFIYDNTTGAGQPIYGTSVETTGIDFTQIAQYPEFYKNHVSGINGTWGGIVPNILPNGICRIENRKLSDGTIDSLLISETGIWHNTNTVNPTGGIDDILIIDIIQSVSEPNNENLIKVYSVNDQLMLHVTMDQPINVKIINLLGQTMINKSFSGSYDYQFTHYLKAGAYIVTVSQGTTFFNTKFVVQ